MLQLAIWKHILFCTPSFENIPPPFMLPIKIRTWYALHIILKGGPCPYNPYNIRADICPHEHTREDKQQLPTQFTHLPHTRHLSRLPLTKPDWKLVLLGLNIPPCENLKPTNSYIHANIPLPLNCQHLKSLCAIATRQTYGISVNVKQFCSKDGIENIEL